MSNAFTFRMPAGVPGTVTRLEQSTIEPQVFDSTAPFPAYGVPMKTVAGKMQPMGTGDAATAMTGLLVRPYPTTGSGSNAFGPGTPPTSGVCNRLRRGYMMVQLNGTAAAAKDAQAYVRVAAAATGKPIGGIEAAADSANTVAPASFVFTGPADASGNVEVAYNI